MCARARGRTLLVSYLILESVYFGFALVTFSTQRQSIVVDGKSMAIAC